MSAPLPKVTTANYYDYEINQAYFSCSQIKKAMKCLAGWKAERDLEFIDKKKEGAEDLNFGQYVDNAHLESEVVQTKWMLDHTKQVYNYGKKENGKKTAYKNLDEAVALSRKDANFMDSISGKHQIILTFDDFFGFPYRCRLDDLNIERALATDLKTCKDVNDMVWDDIRKCKVHWIQYWGYDIQAALYRAAIYQKYQVNVRYIIAAMEKVFPFKRKLYELTMDGITMRDPDMTVPWKDVLSDRLAEAVATMQIMWDARNTPHFELERCGHCNYCWYTNQCGDPAPVKYDVRAMGF